MNVVLSTWNLEHIRRRWPQVELRLARAPRVAEAVVADDGTVTVAGIRLASRYDRRREAAVQAANIPEESPEVWVYGGGLGDLPRYLLERSTLQCLHVVILNEALFATLLDHVDHADWLDDPRVSLELDPPVDRVLQPYCVQSGCLRTMSDHGPLGRLKGLLHLELSSGFINRDFSDNPVMRQRLGETLPLLDQAGEVGQLYDTRPGGLMLVVGAGPTLGKQLSWVGQGRSRFTIIATSSALRPLFNAGILPDVVVAVDPFPILAAQFDFDLSRYGQVPLVCFPVVDPEIIAAWPGPRLVACSSNPLYWQWWQRYPRAVLHSGGSVIHPATDLAVRMGGKTILLLGCDFAFAGGQVRDEGSPELSFGILSGGSMEVTDGQGRPVKTVASLRQYLLEMEAFIRLHPQVRFINASREGARIQGTTFLDQEAPALGIRLPKNAGEKPLPPVRPVTTHQVAVALAQATTALHRWQLVEASGALRQLLRAVRLGGNPLLEARILVALAESGMERGRLTEAREPLLEIPEYKPMGWSTADEITALRITAWCCLQEGNAVEAGKKLDLAISLAAGLGDAAAESAVHRMVGKFYVHLGRYDDGLGHLQRALLLAGQTSDLWETFHGLRQQGEIHQRRQEYDQARQVWQQALAMLDTLDAAPVLRADIRNQLFFLELEIWKAARAADGPLIRCCHALRRGEEAWGYDLLVQWIDSLLKHPGQLTIPGVGELLSQVIACQKRRDSIALADLLEYDLAPLLGAARHGDAG